MSGATPQENYTGYLRRLAKAEGMDENDEDALRRMDRKRKKRMSNQEWVNPHDPDAEITRMKDGSTHLAYKVEQAVDLQTGAIVAVTTHGGATGDTESIRETLPAAGEAVASEIATQTQGKYRVNQNGIQEVVTDKGYHSGTGLREIAEWKVRSYISEPERGRRKWKSKLDEQAAVYANRRRITGSRGLALLRQRGERSERPFAHQFETGAGRRLHVRGRNNVHKKLLVQAAACNLALLMRSMLGAGTPKGLQDRVAALLFAILRALLAYPTHRRLTGEVSDKPTLTSSRLRNSTPQNVPCRKRGGSDTTRFPMCCAPSCILFKYLPVSPLISGPHSSMRIFEKPASGSERMWALSPQREVWSGTLSLLSRRATSKPSMSGNCTSDMIRSGCSKTAASKPR